jgi:hypothetical protein
MLPKQNDYLSKGIIEPTISKTGKGCGKKIKFDINKVSKITNFQFPEWNRDGGKYKSKYRVRISYIDTSGHARDKSVFFGEVGRHDYVDHKLENLRDIYLSKCKKPTSQFDSLYWDINLLNGTKNDLISAFQFLRSSVLN